jgi:hypothetical protein
MQEREYELPRPERESEQAGLPSRGENPLPRPGPKNEESNEESDAASEEDGPRPRPEAEL